MPDHEHIFAPVALQGGEFGRMRFQPKGSLEGYTLYGVCTINGCQIGVIQRGEKLELVNVVDKTELGAIDVADFFAHTA